MGKRSKISSEDTRRRRKFLKSYYGDLCFYGCGKPGGTFEHIIPQRDGGANALTNLVLACDECNNKRGHGPMPYIPKANREKLEWYQNLDAKSRRTFHMQLAGVTQGFIDFTFDEENRTASMTVADPDDPRGNCGRVILDEENINILMGRLAGIKKKFAKGAG